jgi:hypothetical protein
MHKTKSIRSPPGFERGEQTRVNKLRDVLAENYSNCSESAIQANSERAHSGGSGKSHQCQNEQILDQTLTLLISVQQSQQLNHIPEHR